MANNKIYFTISTKPNLFLSVFAKYFRLFVRSVEVIFGFIEQIVLFWLFLESSLFLHHRLSDAVTLAVDSLGDGYLMVIYHHRVVYILVYMPILIDRKVA